MPSRTLLFVAILVVAATAPYLVVRGLEQRKETNGNGTQVTSLLSRFTNSSEQASSNVADLSTLPPPPGEVADGAAADVPLPGRLIDAPQVSGPPGISVADLLRFDITPRWLGQNWSRVTACLAEPDWQGLRVPVVTGSQPYDLAGTVSYSFNMEQQLERINLYAVTGDCEPLTAFVQQRLGMQQYPSPVGLLFVGFYQDQPLSMLRVRNAPLQDTQKSSIRYEVDLEMNLPHPGAKLSDERLKRWELLLEFEERRSKPPAAESPETPTGSPYNQLPPRLTARRQNSGSVE